MAPAKLDRRGMCHWKIIWRKTSVRREIFFGIWLLGNNPKKFYWNIGPIFAENTNESSFY
jgi:hypothetical protein